ncbi:Transposase [Popillia japonica]|uniref:Transposase n=1 Tax=Popillia japonica TaxID=7064 RepID=A0AAW1N0Z1_POPJA
MVKKARNEKKKKKNWVASFHYIFQIKAKDQELEVSTSTIHRRLIEGHFFGRKPRKTPLLQARHVKKRLDFANEHLAKWRNIFWRDESKIVVFCTGGRRQIYNETGECRLRSAIHSEDSEA